MLAEIITIGDEILIGQIVDSNSAWMAQQLNLVGVSIKQITSVSDNEEHILNALKEAATRADLILITGGLGPTKDDITKATFCKFFNTQLVFNEKVFSDIENIFGARGVVVSEINKKQAEVPANCIALRNPVGTAPGMWFEHNSKVYVSMPGVPYEMMKLMELEVLPKIKLHFKTPFILHKTILTQGIGESMLAEKIKEWEEKLPPYLKLAYLPSVGAVRLRLSGYGNEEQSLKNDFDLQFDELDLLVKKYSYGYNDDTLEAIIGKLLLSEKKAVSTAESCTGGKIANTITKVPGSSNYYKGSIVAYANEVKTNLLQVPASIIEKYGAVSQQVVEEMAKGALVNLKTDYAIATSGIAGPDGGSELKPVGLVWIAVANKETVISKQFLLGNHRERTINVATLSALNMLRKMLLKEI